MFSLLISAWIIVDSVQNSWQWVLWHFIYVVWTFDAKVDLICSVVYIHLWLFVLSHNFRCGKLTIKWIWFGLVCLNLTSLCHSNGHIETIPAREINPFTALTRIRSQLLRTQWSTSNHQRVDMTTPQTSQPSGLAHKVDMGYDFRYCKTITVQWVC